MPGLVDLPDADEAVGDPHGGKLGEMRGRSREMGGVSERERLSLWELRKGLLRLWDVVEHLRVDQHTLGGRCQVYRTTRQLPLEQEQQHQHLHSNHHRT
jgi:hypothetical protein